MKLIKVIRFIIKLIKRPDELSRVIISQKQEMEHMRDQSNRYFMNLGDYSLKIQELQQKLENAEQKLEIYEKICRINFDGTKLGNQNESTN